MTNIFRTHEEAVGMSFKEAKEYLKQVGLWETYKDYDGFSIMSAASDHKKESLN